MGDVRRFPADRSAALRIDMCDPGLDTDLNKAVAGKPPPHNLDVEGALLAALFGIADLRDFIVRYGHQPDVAASFRRKLDDVLALFVVLKPEHFYSLANARIYQAMRHLVTHSTPIDRHTVAAWIAEHGWTEKIGGVAYLDRLARETPASANVTAHATIVIECWERRKHIEIFQRRSAELYDDCDDWPARKAELRIEMGRVTAPTVALAGRPVGAVIQDARAQIQEAAQGAVLGVRYPWASIENMVGLLARGQQTILAGLSEHGKTAAMMAIVVAVASTPIDSFGYGEAVYVVTGEMPGPTLMARTACSFARVDAARLFAGGANADELAKVQVELDALENLPIVIDDKPAAAAEIARRVKAHQSAFATGRARKAPKAGQTAGDLLPPCRLQLVVGDHAQELAAKEAGHDEKERIGNCAVNWRDYIAKDLDVHTCVLSQLKMPEQRGPRPKFPPWPQVEHLFGSPNKIKASADTVIAVQRPELLMGGSIPAKWLGVMGICRLKGRFGGAGRRVLFGYDLGNITEELPAAMRQALAARGEYQDDDET